jgi:hypothetical protein
LQGKGKLWRSIIDRKYCENGNIFLLRWGQASPFWKGVMLASQAVKFGYRWLVGNGEKVKF